ncbi:hypothetical protein B9G98_04639 [Wickerhamiella sorbophila]|uniref:BOD1/SHG1 domain-containing protein n=1 Tax=Wickerhamiella sorbophila TaxID=45607 RepID=A0A2T0FPY6_9ASCO|nr:hypothetical protein B9G98_04639 [Wickerhamiella sorbophila]PRT57019.1 hypothetical protein B9G98_04639 [Wickerhamiella sorbophila]
MHQRKPLVTTLALTRMATAGDLVAKYKRCGAFDEERAKLFESLGSSDYITSLKTRIEEFVAKEVENNLQLLDGDTTKSAALLEGAVTRAIVQSDENKKVQQEAIDHILTIAQKDVLAKLKTLQ